MTTFHEPKEVKSVANSLLDELVGPLNSKYSGLTSCGQYMEARGFARANSTITAARLLEVLAGFQAKFHELEIQNVDLKHKAILGIGHVAAACVELYPDVLSAEPIHYDNIDGTYDFEWPGKFDYCASGEFIDLVQQMIELPLEDKNPDINFSYNLFTAERLIEIMSGFQQQLTFGSRVRLLHDLKNVGALNEDLRQPAITGMSYITAMLAHQFPELTSQEATPIREDGREIEYSTSEYFKAAITRLLKRV